jgi:hypothetical protein
MSTQAPVSAPPGQVFKWIALSMLGTWIACHASSGLFLVILARLLLLGRVLNAWLWCTVTGTAGGVLLGAFQLSCARALRLSRRQWLLVSMAAGALGGIAVSALGSVVLKQDTGAPLGLGFVLLGAVWAGVVGGTQWLIFKRQLGRGWMPVMLTMMMTGTVIALEVYTIVMAFLRNAFRSIV